MALLSQRFYFEATRVGRKLIRDIMLNQMRCQRLNTEGQAGGDKALEGGVFSKLPIAGSLFADREHAIKTASLELKTIQALKGVVRRLGGGKFHFPLFCVMDFMGHRVSSSFYLPLGNSKVHGGLDHKDQPLNLEVAQFVSQLSEELHLEPHSDSVTDEA